MYQSQPKGYPYSPSGAGPPQQCPNPAAAASAGRRRLGLNASVPDRRRTSHSAFYLDSDLTKIDGLPVLMEIKEILKEEAARKALD